MRVLSTALNLFRPSRRILWNKIVVCSSIWTHRPHFAPTHYVKFLDILLQELNLTHNYGFVAPLAEKESVARYVEDVLDQEHVGKNTEQLKKVVKAIMESEEAPEGENANLEEVCQNHFQDFVGNSIFGICYLLFASNTVNCDQLCKRLMSQKGKDLTTQDPQEAVALLLSIYFSRKHWNSDEVCKLIDLSQLQRNLGNMMRSNQLQCAEVCAICIGLSKIEDFFLHRSDIRLSFYEFLYDLGQSERETLTKIEEYTIIKVCVLLARGNAFFKDERTMIEATLFSFVNKIKTINISTAIKLTTYGFRLQLHVPKLTTAFSSRLKDEVDNLLVSDLLGITHFLSLSERNPDTEMAINSIEKRLTALREEEESFQFNPKECIQFVQTLSHLSSASKFNEDLTSLLIRSVNSFDTLPNHPYECAKVLLKQIYQTLFPMSYKTFYSSKHAESEMPTEITRILRSVVNIYTNIHFDSPNFPIEERLRTDHLDHLVQLIRKPSPMEAYSPQMSLEKLSSRNRNNVMVKRAIDKCFNTSGYCDFVHILPNFGDPDVVMGTLSGTPMSFPLEFSQSNKAFKKAPDIGYWYVFSVNAGARVEGNSFGSNEKLKEKLLTKLGYTVVKVDLKSLLVEVKPRRFSFDKQDVPTKFESLLQSLIAGYQGKHPHEEEP